MSFGRIYSLKTAGIATDHLLEIVPSDPPLTADLDRRELTGPAPGPNGSPADLQVGRCLVHSEQFRIVHVAPPAPPHDARGNSSCRIGPRDSAFLTLQPNQSHHAVTSSTEL